MIGADGRSSPATLFDRYEMMDVTLNNETTTSPALFPFAMDCKADMVLWMQLTREDYSAASFLDQRMLRPGATGTWKTWDEVRCAAVGLPLRCHFIFHISHVGSTLLSRLLGQHSALFSLREPLILRTLAGVQVALGKPNCPWSRDELDKRLGVFLAYWSRTFTSDQCALIKATSFVSEMAEVLMERVASSQAAFMYVSPTTFLKALLDGAMTDISDQAERRLGRLQRRLGNDTWQVKELSPGESVAMSWLSEMLSLDVAGRRFSDRVLWIDFDRFLEAPDSGLAAALQHFEVDDSPKAVASILAGATMNQYAKAPKHSFDAKKRTQLLNQSEDRHGTEIAKGLAWLDHAASAFPAVREVIEATAR